MVILKYVIFTWIQVLFLNSLPGSLGVHAPLTEIPWFLGWGGRERWLQRGMGELFWGRTAQSWYWWWLNDWIFVKNGEFCGMYIREKGRREEGKEMESEWERCVLLLIEAATVKIPLHWSWVFSTVFQSVSWNWSREKTLERNSLSSNPGSTHCLLVRLRASYMTSQCLKFHRL